MYYIVQLFAKNNYASEEKAKNGSKLLFLFYDSIQCSLITWKDWHSTYCHMKQYHEKYMSLNARVELTVCHVESAESTKMQNK